MRPRTGEHSRLRWAGVVLATVLMGSACSNVAPSGSSEAAPTASTPASTAIQSPPTGPVATSAPAPAEPSASSGPTPTAAGRAVQNLPQPVDVDPRVVAGRATVPALCYHQIRDFRPSDSAEGRALTTPPAAFARQMDLLDREGWTPISVEQYYEHLTSGAALPPKPILLTFDDASEGHATEVLPVLRRHGFTATFFVMTVVLDKPGWLSREQVRELDRAGMTIGVHSFDHHPVAGYRGADWKEQVEAPKRQLEEIVGHPIRWWAYPYGVWRRPALPRLESAGFAAAFQLEDAPDRDQPLLTLGRVLMVSGGGLPGFRRQLRAATRLDERHAGSSR